MPGTTNAPHAAGSAGYRRITLALFAAGLATFASMYSAQAVLPALADDLSLSPAVAALAVSATTGVLAVAIIPASVLSERYGRTRVMVVSAALCCTIGLLLPLSPNIEVLLLGRALQGAALAGVPAVAMAYLAEEVRPSDLGAAMGRYVAGTTLGGLLGRIVPSGVLDISTWRWALEVTAIATLVFALVFVKLLPPSRHFERRSIRPRTVLRNLVGHLSDPTLRVLFSLGFLLMGGFVSVYNFIGFRLVASPFSLPQALVGLIFVMYLAGTVTSAVAGRAADRYGRSAVLASSIAVMGLGLATTIPDSLPAILVGLFLFTGGFFGAHSVASGWVGRVAVTNRAEASSLYLFAYYLGSSVAGAGAGLAYARGGWDGAAIYVGVLVSVGLVLAATTFRRRPVASTPVGAAAAE